VILLANLEMLVGHTRRRLRDREVVVAANGDLNHLHGFEVDHSLELGRLLDGKIGGRGPPSGFLSTKIAARWNRSATLGP